MPQRKPDGFIADGFVADDGFLADPANANTHPAPSYLSQVGENFKQGGNVLRDVAEGIGSGVVSTGVGMYNLARKGLNQLSPSVPSGGEPGVPQNTAGSPGLPPAHPAIQAATQAPDHSGLGWPGTLGKGAEQIAEFMVPTANVTRGAKAIEGVTAGVRGARALNAAGRAALEATSAGGVRGAQTGGDPAEMEKAALTAGGLSGVGSLATESGPMLKASAEKAYARVLGPTTKPNKILTQRVVPELLDRGVMAATRKGLLKKASASAEDAGQQLEAAHDALPNMSHDLGALNQKIDDAASQAFTVQGPNGPIQHSKAADSGIVAVDDLKKRLLAASTVDPATGQRSIPHKTLLEFRRKWDDLTNAKRGFTTNDMELDAAGNAMRGTAGAAREALNAASPEIAAGNKEYSLWKNVTNVLNDTILRTQSQAIPLTQQIKTGAGLSGGLLHGVGTAAAYATGLKMFQKFMDSPAWLTTSAVAKNHISNLLQSGKADEAITLMAQLGAGTVAVGTQGHPAATYSPQQ